MNITTEQIKDLYNKAAAMHLAEKGVEHDNIMLTEAGEIKCTYDWHCRGGHEEIETYYTLHDLQSGVTEVIARHKAEAEAAELRRQERENQEREQRAEAEKKRRHAEYLKMKAEFEHE